MLPDFIVMAVVYTRGIKPVEINGTKLLECYQRALLLATTDDTKSRIYNGMLLVYSLFTTLLLLLILLLIL